MRDRLIEILREPIPVIRGYDVVGESRMSIVDAERYADRLLENGAIVPPCKVGDTVYMVTPGGKLHEKKVLGSASVVGLNLRDEIWMKHSFTCESALVFNEDDIGKTVFLTRKEAEQALKGAQHEE